MVHTVLAAALICFLSAPASAQNAKPNFTGTWSLDVAKSDFGQFPPPESVVQVIDHKEPNLRITTTTKPANQDPVTNVLNLTTDGKEATNKIRMMGNEHEVKSTVKWDDQKLAASMKFDVQGATIEFNDSWALTGASVLTLSRVIKTPQGEIVLKTVYNKQ